MFNNHKIVIRYIKQLNLNARHAKGWMEFKSKNEDERSKGPLQYFPSSTMDPWPCIPSIARDTIISTLHKWLTVIKDVSASRWLCSIKAPAVHEIQWRRWGDYLPLLDFANNNSISPSITFSPFYINYLHHAFLLISFIVNTSHAYGYVMTHVHP